MVDHVHMLISILPKYAVSQVWVNWYCCSDNRL